MGRQYPRFLFSDPKNTKSKGPFIVHLLEPRLIFRVFKREDSEIVMKGYKGPWAIDKDFGIIVLDDINFEEGSPEAKVMDDALEWITSQKHYGFIDF